MSVSVIVILQIVSLLKHKLYQLAAAYEHTAKPFPRAASLIPLNQPLQAFGVSCEAYRNLGVSLTAPEWRFATSYGCFLIVAPRHAFCDIGRSHMHLQPKKYCVSHFLLGYFA